MPPPRDELELVRRYQKGDVSALMKLLDAYRGELRREVDYFRWWVAEGRELHEAALRGFKNGVSLCPTRDNTEVWPFVHLSVHRYLTEVTVTTLDLTDNARRVYGFVLDAWEHLALSALTEAGSTTAARVGPPQEDVRQVSIRNLIAARVVRETEAASAVDEFLGSLRNHSIPLTTNNEIRRIARFQAGDQAVFEELLRAHESRLTWEVRRFTPDGALDEDFLSIAMQGFLEGVKRFDITRGTKLWTYARYRVRYRLTDQLRRSLHISERGSDAYRTVRECYTALAAERGVEPSHDALVEAATVRLVGEKGWSEVMARDAASEVLDALTRQEVPLARDDSEDDMEGAAVIPADTLQNDSDEASWFISEQLLKVFAHAKEKLGARAEKWLVLVVLHEKLMWNYSWEKIIHVLLAPTPETASRWHLLHSRVPMVSTVLPSNWSAVCENFRTPPPELTSGAVRTFYSRCRTQLLGKKDERRPETF